MKTEFPKALAAVQRVDGSQWQFADAILAEVGPPTKDGENLGAFEQFQALSGYLAANGFSYSVGTLRDYRTVAYRFPKAERTEGVSFSTHLLCREPEQMKEMLAAVGARPTYDQAREWRMREYLPRKRDSRSPWKAFVDCTLRAEVAAKRALALVQEHDMSDRDVQGALGPLMQAWKQVREAAVSEGNGNPTPKSKATVGAR